MKTLNKWLIGSSITLVLIFIAMIIATFVRITNENDERRLARFERLDYNQRVDEYKSLKSAVRKPIASCEKYFVLLSRIDKLEGSCRLTLKDEKVADGRYPNNFFLVELHQMRNDFSYASDAFIKRHIPEFEVAREKYEKMGTSPIIGISEPVNYSRLGRWLFLLPTAGVPFITIVLLQLVALLKEGGCSAYQFSYMFLGSLLMMVGVGAKAFGAKKNGDGGSKKNKKKFELNLSSETLPKYLGLDGAIFHPGMVQQTGLTISSLATNLYFNYWQSVPLGGRELRPNFGNETDVSVGWVKKFAGIKSNLSATYLNVTPLAKAPAGDLVQLSGNFSKMAELRGKQTLTSFVWLRKVMPLKYGLPPGGHFVHLGIGHSVEFNRKLSVNESFEFVRDSGAFGYKKGWLSRQSVILNWKLHKCFSIQLPIFRSSFPINKVDSRKFEYLFGMGIAYGW